MWELMQLNISPQGYLILSLIALAAAILLVIISLKNIITSNSIIGWWKAYLPKGLTMLFLTLITMLIGLSILANLLITKNMGLERDDILMMEAIILISAIFLYLATAEIRKSLEYLLPRE